MENVKITVKVNGECVDISTISTETFEKVKAAAAKLKKPPAVSIADFEYEGVCEHRLILHIPGVTFNKHEIIVIDLEYGEISNYRNLEDGIPDYYINVRELK